MAHNVLILNAFSLNMVPSSEGAETNIQFRPVSEESAQLCVQRAKTVFSGVGHASTAGLFSALLGAEVAASRANVALSDVGASVNGEDLANCEILIGQYSGPRLEEGATELPEGARIVWFVLNIAP